MDSIDAIIQLLNPIEQKHPEVALKLSRAIEQFQNARSVDEYQQLGILIRDAWIEFAQKLFNINSVPQGQEIPSSSDAKAMLERSMVQWPNCPEQLIKLAKTLFNLANEIQHDRNIGSISPTWGIYATVLAMSLILDLDSQNARLADRRYYKCPICGSLDLSCKTDREVDPIDGPLWRYELWKCQDCDWEHYLMLD